MFTKKYVVVGYDLYCTKFHNSYEPVWPTKNNHSISVTQFSSLITHHSSLITYISSLITHHSSLIFSHSFGNITFIFITQFFHTIHGSHTCQSVQCCFFFFLFFSFLFFSWVGVGCLFVCFFFFFFFS